MLNLTSTYKQSTKGDVPCLCSKASCLEALNQFKDTPYCALPVIDFQTDQVVGILKINALLNSLVKKISLTSSINSLISPLPFEASVDKYLYNETLKQNFDLIIDQSNISGAVDALRVFHYQEDLINAILEAIPSPVVGIDRDGIVRLCNSAMQNIFPEQKTAIRNRPIADFIQNTQLPNIAKTGKKQCWEKIQIKNRSFLSHRLPLVINGQRIGALAMLQEISELEHISSQLKSTRLIMEELDGIIESSFDGIYVTDNQGKTLRVNKAYLSITGLKEENIIGVNMKELVEQKIFDQSASLSVLKTGKSISIIQKIHNGATVMASAKPLRDSNGCISRVVTTVRDLTELNKLRDELNAADSLKNQYQKELHELKQKLPRKNSVIIRSPAMQKVLNLALRLGSVDSTVLIQGESGTGKEVIAEIIHHNSSRKNQPFIKINCTAIPENLLESELFGYTSGAFTGASKNGKEGLIAAANNGTLLLDEVGDLPAQLQVKLLRVIQEKQIRRIGDNTPRNIDVRFLAATNQNLLEMIKQKSFREDLYYRLNVVPMEIPPLRERKEDILFMAQEFLQNFCKQHNQTKKLCPSTFSVLTNYSWPGNVRELENMMERLVVISSKEIITPQDIPDALGASLPDSVKLEEHKEKTLKEILAKVEASVLKSAFQKYKTTRQVANALGIDQSNVVRKLKKLGIN